MADCNHDCSNCSANCSSREGGIPKEAPHELSKIKKVIGVVSGKGGVGKSLVTSMMAVSARRLGYETAVLDADITGPSIGRTFGVHGRAQGNSMGILPMMSKTGIKLMSVNFMLADETDPVVWRGSMIANAVKQFWTDVIWDDVDFMFIDMPPGTGDVPLTVFQSLPVDGIIIVASPQELVGMIVEKAVKMANMMNIPVLGLVENMSYVACPDCGKKIYIFGEGKVDETAAKYGLPVLAKLPIDPQLAKNCDQGVIELFEGDYMDKAMAAVEELLK
ncbi:MAG: Mrp/NBP35 family ATP-binding protein [Oscillospiraceae bacterium]|nr:Mrp/NBP35 family ATP-binding protein [Oscillospiraceae bacterium]